MVALVDDEDYELLSRVRWYAVRCGRHLYAARAVHRAGRQSRIYMHREILGTPPDFHTDHRDFNGLNNQRSNLRVATHAQNMANRRKYGANQYRGVVVTDGRAYLNATFNRKHAFAIFGSAEDAAREYDRLATEHFGEFARLNFPSEAA